MTPKFRAWHESEQEMLKDIWFDWQDFENYGSLNEIFRDKRLIFMQSTGLFDKNGVEIFEGDIVTGGSITYEVHYGSHSFRQFSGVGFYLIWESDDIYIVEKFLSDITYEVIGNIYENPELVEGGIQ